MKVARRMRLGLVASLALAAVSQGHLDEDFLPVGMASAGGTVASGLAVGATASGPGAKVLAISLILGGGLSATTVNELDSRELVHQLKTDHETWRAGGEMSPFLAGVYREIGGRSRGFAGPGGGLDERMLNEAIDRLVARAERPMSP